MCNQQRLGPDCAYAQSDQSLYLSLDYSMSVQLLTEHHLGFLRLKGGCTGLSESTLVKMPHCWKSCHGSFEPHHKKASFNKPWVDPEEGTGGPELTPWKITSCYMFH